MPTEEQALTRRHHEEVKLRVALRHLGAGAGLDHLDLGALLQLRELTLARLMAAPTGR